MNPSESVEKAVVELIRKRSIACEKLTEEQLAVALIQALCSGDFTKFVEVGTDRQQVVYTPYREHQRLKDEISRLQKLLAENGINHQDNQ